MHLYSPILDWLAWAAGIGGLFAGFKYLSEPVGERRGLMKLATMASLGTALSLAGLGGLLANLRAPLINVRGVLEDVRHHHGGRSSSVEFNVRDPAGQITRLTAERDLALIDNGEKVTVRYQGAMQRALNVTILSGSSVGQTYEMSDNKSGSTLVIAVGLALLGFGVVGWLNDRNADDEPEDTTPQPQSGVDEGSILHIRQEDR